MAAKAATNAQMLPKRTRIACVPESLSKLKKGFMSAVPFCLRPLFHSPIVQEHCAWVERSFTPLSGQSLNRFTRFTLGRRRIRELADRGIRSGWSGALITESSPPSTSRFRNYHFVAKCTQPVSHGRIIALSPVVRPVSYTDSQSYVLNEEVVHRNCGRCLRRLQGNGEDGIYETHRFLARQENWWGHAH